MPRKLVISLVACATVVFVATVPIGPQVVKLERVAAQPATTVTAVNASVTPSSVSATGFGYVPASPLPPQAQTFALSIAVQERITAADTRSRLQALRATLGTLTAALGRAGIPASAVHIGTFGVLPVYASGSGSPGSGGGRPSIQEYAITQNVQVDVSGTEQLADAMQVGMEAGVTSMSASIREAQRVAAEPDPAAVAPAVAQATADAKALAQAVARSAGVRLGGVRTVAVAPLLYISVALGAYTWRVQVTVTYDIVGSSP